MYHEYIKRRFLLPVNSHLSLNSAAAIVTMRVLTALPSYLESLEVAILCLLMVSPVICQEKPEDWPSSYNVGPYKHVYPPTNLSINQLACTPNPALNRTCPLFFALIMSFGGAHSNSGVVPGIQVALDHINARTDLLPGYTLHYTLQDSQVSKKKFNMSMAFFFCLRVR